MTRRHPFLDDGFIEYFTKGDVSFLKCIASLIEKQVLCTRWMGEPNTGWPNELNRISFKTLHELPKMV